MRRVVAAAAASSLLVLGCSWWEEEVRQEAALELMEFGPVWAAAGPYENGEASARAMRAAILLTLNEDETSLLPGRLEVAANHAVSYDNYPNAWEEIRLLALEKAQLDSGTLRQVRTWVLEFDEDAHEAMRRANSMR